jgi:subtilisin family serine protease
MRTVRPLLFVCVAAFLAACSNDNPAGTAPELAIPTAKLHRASGNAIAGSYIVAVREGADPRSVAAVAQVEPALVYTAAFNGFAAELNQGQLTALLHNPSVEYVEEDQLFTTTVDQLNAWWGLDRINQRYLPLDGKYSYGYTGSTVYSYIIDTGIRTAHEEFEGRASNVYDAFGGNGQDCHGHGTHVASTVGGRIYGVAKKTRLRGLRVLDCNGSGSTSGIIAAVDWLRNNRVNPAIANMSLGGGYSGSLNTAVNNLSTSGVFVAVAAGNDNKDACNYSPASASQAYTVAASTSSDAKASFSNWGGCVNIYAPGASIRAAWSTSNTAYNTISGTSMASPHVAGTSALIKHRYGNISSTAVRDYLHNAGTNGLISGNPSGTINKLLHKYVTAW